MPFFAALDALLSTVDVDVERCLLVAAGGGDRLVAGGVLGGNTMWLVVCGVAMPCSS
jgi:hypothetical protein